MFGHTAVLIDEVVQFLQPRPGGRFIDATLGAGGHSRAILEQTAPGGTLLAIDQDESALARTEAVLASFAPRIVFAHSNFREVGPLATEHGFLQCDGLLPYIGISSIMFTDPSRWFSLLL